MLLLIISYFTVFSGHLTFGVDKTGHAVYVSVVEINYNSVTRQGQMQVKLFTDDFEDAILNLTGQKVKLNKRCDENLALMTGYLQQHLKLTIAGKQINYELVGCENVDISTWLECSFTCEPDWSEVEIMGNQLMELFPTQSNVFTLKYNDQKRLFRLTNSQTATTLSFN